MSADWLGNDQLGAPAHFHRLSLAPRDSQKEQLFPVLVAAPVRSAIRPAVFVFPRIFCAGQRGDDYAANARSRVYREANLGTLLRRDPRRCERPQERQTCDALSAGVALPGLCR
ncbi:hypothetical protein MRX96_055717 [Rhipicephalus microplus]